MCSRFTIPHFGGPPVPFVIWVCSYHDGKRPPAPSVAPPVGIVGQIRFIMMLYGRKVVVIFTL